MKIANHILNTAVTGLFLTAAFPAQAVEDTMVNTVTVTESCFVNAVGVNFGTVVTPMAAAQPGILPNLADSGDLNVEVDLPANPNDYVPELGVLPPLPTSVSVNAFTLGLPGIVIVCSSAPTAVTLQLAGGSKNLLADGLGPFNSTMESESDTLNYTLGFLAVQTPTLLNGVVATYAGAFLIDPTKTQIPIQDIAAGTYEEQVLVEVIY